jgi:hypothetical protein
MVRPFKCLCGALNCIGYVAGAKYLALETLTNYFINPHIQQLARSAPPAADSISSARGYRGARSMLNDKLPYFDAVPSFRLLYRGYYPMLTRDTDGVASRRG